LTEQLAREKSRREKLQEKLNQVSANFQMIVKEKDDQIEQRMEEESQHQKTKNELESAHQSNQNL
jgi:hypothetical protein